MKKIILAAIAAVSIICLTGCESPEERDHRLDVEEVEYVEDGSESCEESNSNYGTLYANVYGECLELTSYRTYAKNDSVLLYLKEDYWFRNDDGNRVSCKEIVTSLNNVFIFQKCEKKTEQ
jgi:hypothetical protein